MTNTEPAIDDLREEYAQAELETRMQIWLSCPDCDLRVDVTTTPADMAATELLIGALRGAHRGAHRKQGAGGADVPR